MFIISTTSMVEHNIEYFLISSSMNLRELFCGEIVKVLSRILRWISFVEDRQWRILGRCICGGSMVDCFDGDVGGGCFCGAANVQDSGEASQNEAHVEDE